MNSYQCYYVDENGNRCKSTSMSLDDIQMWCSLEHKTKWQEKNYRLDMDGKKRRPTITEMQKRLKEMARDAHVKSKTEKNGQIRI